MYTPRHFAEHDLAALDELIAHDAFVTLVHQQDGAPFATHLPVLYRRDGVRVELRGHWSKANPQWRDIGGQSALIIVHGPHAYVSPTWYVDSDQRVPTWNYATAHLYGRVETTDDPAELEAIVTALSDIYEAKHDSGWRFERTTPDTRRELRGIVGFRFFAERIELKFKLSQNHPVANQRGVIDHLEQHGGDDRRAVAAMMRTRLNEEARDET
jgi:transcriptional regulator